MDKPAQLTQVGLMPSTDMGQHGGAAGHAVLLAGIVRSTASPLPVSRHEKHSQHSDW